MLTFRLAFGTVVGALYVVGTSLSVASGNIEPQGGAAHDIVQITPLFVESFANVAVNSCVPLACTEAELGDTVTLIDGLLSALPPHPEEHEARAAASKIRPGPPR